MTGTSVLSATRYMGKLMADIRKHSVAIALRACADDENLLGVAHKAIEDRLVEWRDMRLSTPLAANGLVIHEKDGKDSNVIRMTPREAMRIGLEAIAKELVKEHEHDFDYSVNPAGTCRTCGYND